MLRNGATPAERRLWFGFLREQHPQWYRQRPLDRFIVDFYCPRLRLVVEVDGATHDGPDATIRDAERTRFLRARGLRVVRLTNGAVLHCFADACAWLADRMAEQQRQAP